MKIAFMSDLHLEFCSIVTELPDADIMLLCGDIGTLDSLTKNSIFDVSDVHPLWTIIKIAKKYPRVLWIPGNHEYYDSNISTNIEQMNRLLAEVDVANVTYSDKICLDVGSIRLIGATLWTDIYEANPLEVLAASTAMNDYSCITIKDLTIESGIRYLTPDDTMSIHKDHRNFIQNSVDSTKQNVIFTHHAPAVELARSDGLNSAYYCTDMTDFILDNTAAIPYWIHGHTHDRKEDNIDRTTIVTNARGYMNDPLYKISVIEI